MSEKENVDTAPVPPPTDGGVAVKENASPDPAQKEGNSSPAPKRDRGKGSGIGKNIITFFLIFLSIWLLMSTLSGGISASAQAMSYDERCPDQAKELSEIIKNSGTGNPSTFYPLGNEKATSTQYIKADLACVMDYALYPATQTPDEAMTALESAEWSVDENVPGVFAASKEGKSGTYIISYPDGGYEEGKTSLIVRYSPN